MACHTPHCHISAVCCGCMAMQMACHTPNAIFQLFVVVVWQWGDGLSHSQCHISAVCCGCMAIGRNINDSSTSIQVQPFNNSRLLTVVATVTNTKASMWYQLLHKQVISNLSLLLFHWSGIDADLLQKCSFDFSFTLIL